MTNILKFVAKEIDDSTIALDETGCVLVGYDEYIALLEAVREAEDFNCADDEGAFCKGDEGRRTNEMCEVCAWRFKYNAKFGELM